jgi:hypothetical protein
MAKGKKTELDLLNKRGYGRGCWRKKRTNDQGAMTNDESENQNTSNASRG